MQNEELLDKAIAFVNDRASDKVKSGLDRVLFSSLGGSRMMGTFDVESDYDLRVVLFDTERDVMSGRLFGAHKFVEGEGKINGSEDLDVELFGTMELLNQLRNGETIAFEVLSVEESDMVFANELGREVYDYLKSNLRDFVSKSLVNRYFVYYRRMYHGVFPIVSRVKSPARLDRIEKFGYDSKCLMKAAWVVELLETLLETRELNLKQNTDYLRYLRSGVLSVEDARELLADLDKRIEVLEKESEVRVPRRVDESFYYDFVYEFNKKFSGV